MSDQTENKGTGVLDASFLSAALDGIKDTITIIDRSYNMVYTNQAGLDAIGEDSLLEVIGDGTTACYEKLYHSERRCTFCAAHHVFDSGSPAFNTFRKGTGAERIVKEVSTFPLADDNGNIDYVIEISRNVTSLEKELIANSEFADIITGDSKMQEIFDLMESVAPTSSTVLIQGETGSGKELVARAIHRASRRNGKEFVSINCGAMTETLLETELFGHERGAFTGAERKRIGAFERADKGTLFLDEFGVTSPAMQVKILRVLQEGELTRVGGSETINVDVRYLCATNLDLKEAVDRGDFREDLYYRINVIPITLPALRDRGGDVELLAHHYLTQFNQVIGRSIRGFSPAAIEQMRHYSWPGNIRELRNLVERAVILTKGDTIERVDVPNESSSSLQGTSGSLQQGATMKDAVDEVEKQYLVEALKKYGGNINKTASVAGVNTRTIHRKMSQFGIRKEIFK